MGPLPRGALLLRPQFPHTRPMGSAPQSLMEKWQGLRELRSGPTRPPDLLVTGRAWGWRRGCRGEQRGEWPCSQSSKGRYVASTGEYWATHGGHAALQGLMLRHPRLHTWPFRGEHSAIRWGAPGLPWLNTRPPMVGHLATGVGRGGTWRFLEGYFFIYGGHRATHGGHTDLRPFSWGDKAVSIHRAIKASASPWLDHRAPSYTLAQVTLPSQETHQLS